MSVRPVSMQRGALTVWHDEEDHGGDVALATIRFEYDTSQARQEEDYGKIFNHAIIPLTCPVCGAISAHPIGGGADSVGMGRVFAALFLRLSGGSIKAARDRFRAVSGVDLALDDAEMDGLWRA